MTARWCRRIIAVSHATARFIVDVEGIPAGKVTVIPNGVDLERFRVEPPARARQALGLTDADFVVACVGRLHPHKGQADLVDALAIVRERVPGLVCLVAGEGPERASLEARVRARDLTDRCRFLGSVDRIETIYAACDVAVLPSRFEGMPNTVLEAMAMGRPVVATSVDGSVELVRHGETGVLVPPRNAGALADALMGLARDRAAASRMGARGRAAVEAQYDIQRTVHLVEALYDAEWKAAGATRRS
jgi:glycosyltransferase involved in cell wall biosynthesis